MSIFTRTILVTEIHNLRAAAKFVLNAQSKYNEAMQQMLDYAKKKGLLAKEIKK